MSKNIWYDNQQMTTRIKTILVAVVALIAIGTIQTGENKNMSLAWLNPFDNIANVLNTVEGQFNSSVSPTGTIQQSSGTGVNMQGQSLPQGGLTTQNADPNQTLYYNTNTGNIDQSGIWDTGTNTPSGATPEQQAATARQNAARDSFNQGRGNILSDIRNAATNYAQTGTNNILDFVEGLKSQQQGLDIRRANAVLGQRNAAKNIMGMVGQGIRSFGVNLANRNAGDSSAALAGAQAYGRMGNQQMQDVNQQLGLENANIDVAQQGLNTSRESGRRRFETEKAQKINDLTNYAQQQFATLNAQAEGAGIMDRIAIEQEKENIKNELIQSLASLDAQLGQANTVNPMDQMGVQNKAQELSQLGQGGTQFDFTTTTPTQLQTGAQLGQLPIFSNRRKRA